MKFTLLNFISLLTTSQNKYCIYRASYENHENAILIIISHSDFYNHAIYLYDHFNVDAIAYNAKSPIIKIIDYYFFDSFDEIPDGMEVTGWM